MSQVISTKPVSLDDTQPDIIISEGKQYDLSGIPIQVEFMIEYVNNDLEYHYKLTEEIYTLENDKLFSSEISYSNDYDILLVYLKSRKDHIERLCS